MRADRLFAPFHFTRSRGALKVYDYQIKDIVTDPHAATAQTVFVCVRTPLFDGHRSAALAYANGCRCFVAARGLGLPRDAAVYTVEDPEAQLSTLAAHCFGYPARDITVLGVTGTNGKTSVVNTLASLLRQAGKRVATLTTDGRDLDGIFTKAGPIAPNAADVQRMLRAARRHKIEFAIVEFSAYMLAHHAADHIPFAAVLQTDLVPRHIGAGLFADLAAYRAAKHRLLMAEAALVLLPDTYQAPLVKGNIVRYGESGEIVWSHAKTEVREGVIGTQLAVSYKGENIDAFYPVVGDFAVKNATAAIALALAVGLSPAEIAKGLPLAAPVGRMEQIFSRGGARIFLDTAYEAEDLARVLRALRTVTTGKLSVVLGSVGDRAEQRRAPLGTAAVTYADFAYFTADDPSGEPPEKIARDMVAEIENSSRYRIVLSRSRAIRLAVADLRAGDTLLILGKARDHTQLVNGKEQEFCDRTTALEAAQQS